MNYFKNTFSSIVPNNIINYFSKSFDCFQNNQKTEEQAIKVFIDLENREELERDISIRKIIVIKEVSKLTLRVLLAGAILSPFFLNH